MYVEAIIPGSHSILREKCRIVSSLQSTSVRFRRCGYNHGRRSHRGVGINSELAALAVVLPDQSAFQGTYAYPRCSNTPFQVFARVGPDNSLERLTERCVGLVSDQPSDVYELFVTLFEQLHRLLHPPLGYIFQWCLSE